MVDTVTELGFRITESDPMESVLMFDFDGVIADSLSLFRHAMGEALADFDGGRFLGGEEAFLDLFDGNLYDSLLQSGIRPEDVPRLLENLVERLQPGIPDLPLFPGMSEALRELASDCTLYLISSNHGQPVRAFLESHGLVSLFRDIMGADVDPSKAAKIGRVRCRHPGASLVYVGDTAGDMIEAHRAGVPAAAVLWGWHDRARLEARNPDMIFAHPAAMVHQFRLCGSVP